MGAGRGDTTPLGPLGDTGNAAGPDVGLGASFGLMEAAAALAGFMMGPRADTRA